MTSSSGRPLTFIFFAPHSVLFVAESLQGVDLHGRARRAGT
jgi:hypothetical protein